jgi:hypothetical protein
MMLSPNEFRNAIYLDFEGEGRKRDGTVPMPHMAGLFRPNQTGRSGQYTCAFFKQNWKPASNGIKVAQCVTFDELFAELAIELEKKDGYLVYWTIHEQIILQEYLSDELYARLAPRLFNLHPIAKKYANRKRLFGSNMSAKKRTLEEFFAAIYSKRNPYPPFPLGAAAACRRIDKVCNTNNRWKKFSEKQKAYVRDLVAYNQGDCRSTWLIAKRLGNFYNPA